MENTYMYNMCLIGIYFFWICIFVYIDCLLMAYWLPVPYGWLPIDCLLTSPHPMCWAPRGPRPNGWPHGPPQPGPDGCHRTWCGGRFRRQSIGNQSSDIGDQYAINRRSIVNQYNWYGWYQQGIPINMKQYKWHLYMDWYPHECLVAEHVCHRFWCCSENDMCCSNSWYVAWQSTYICWSLLFLHIFQNTK